MRPLWLALGSILISTAASPLDLDSVCLGSCLGRYQSGFYAGSGRCACVDFVPLNLSQRFDLPRRSKDPKDLEAPHVYDGRDEMHYSPAE